MSQSVLYNSPGHPGDEDPDSPACPPGTPTMKTNLDRLRERAEEVVRRGPAVEAVVLFGSRARGTASPRSDWDVAVIERNGKAADATYRLLDDLPGVRLLGIGADEIERHKNTAGALEAALAREGVTLAGVWHRPRCREEGLNMDMVRIRSNLANATDNVGKAVLAGIKHLYAVEDWERTDWTTVTTGSVDAAEHLAKAVVTGYGLSPREVHFLDALADQLKNAYRGRNDPRQAYWADLIRSMNGTTRTRRLHDADYRRFTAPPAEPLERSVERTGQVQRIQILWLRKMLSRWPEQAADIRYAARAIVDMGEDIAVWRTRYADRQVTAEEDARAAVARLEKTTAGWMATAKALLAQVAGDEAPPPPSTDGTSSRRDEFGG